MVDADLQVTRARVSYVATRVSATMLEALGNPDRFEALLQSPGPVAGLTLSLPYADPDLPAPHVDVNRAFWSNVAEKTRPGQLQAAAAAELRYRGLPLRHRPRAAPRMPGKPRVEVFCLGFGCVTVATLDVFCTPAVPLADVDDAVSLASSTPLETEIGNQLVRSGLADLAELAADSAMALLSPTGTVSASPSYRITSVISAAGGPPPATMPAANDPVHQAMHRLAQGRPQALPPPGEAFVPYWTGRQGFGWAPTELAYILDLGASQLRQSAALQRPRPPAWSTSHSHRLLTMARVHVAADLALLAAAGETSSNRLKAWAPVAAHRLSRLYGPVPASYDFWGLACRSFILSDPQASDRIEAWRTDKLGPYEKLPWPPYPGTAPAPAAAP